MITMTDADEPRRLIARVALVAGTLQVLWTVVNLQSLDEWSTILFQSVAVAAMALVLTVARRARQDSGRTSSIGLGLALGVSVGVALTWGRLSAWIIIGNNF